MNLSICILAYNESTSISKTLESLLKQSLFNNSRNYGFIEIIVVPNGCTDNTAEVARAKLKDLMGAFEQEQSNVRWQVCEITEPGKSNAWNCYVHQFSDPAADFLVLMDADIEFIETQTLTNMLDVFRTNTEAWIAIDQPVKDIALKKEQNLLEKASVAVSGASNPGRLYICGQLYCSPASVLRKIWLPIGLPVEDGFLTAMVVSDRFTAPSNFERIVRVKSASHSFKAYIAPRELVRHEQRIVMGIAINIFLCKYLRAKCNQRQSADSLIEQMNQKEPQWLKHFIKDKISTRRGWILPKTLVFRRFNSLKNHSLSKAVFFAPIALTAFLVDLLIFIPANHKLSKGVGMNYW